MRFILFQLFVGMLCLGGIEASVAATITGNPKGNVTLVEYYDYECPHCRRMGSVIDQLQALYPNLKVVHRVTPLLTSESRLIASFVLAARSQGKWKALHQQLIASFVSPTLNDAEKLATRLGLNTTKILNTMQSRTIQQEIVTNIKLANTHAIANGIYLPILVFGQSNGHGQPIVLTGEQPYSLLLAIVQQLSRNAYVPLVEKKR